MFFEVPVVLGGDPSPENAEVVPLCECCSYSPALETFEPKQDHPRWMLFKFNDPSWEEWRDDYADQYLHLQMKRKGVKAPLDIYDIARIFSVPVGILVAMGWRAKKAQIDALQAAETMNRMIREMCEGKEG
jgi:hypothetical protein